MQSHPLRRTRFGQYQASSAALGHACILFLHANVLRIVSVLWFYEELDKVV